MQRYRIAKISYQAELCFFCALRYALKVRLSTPAPSRSTRSINTSAARSRPPWGSAAPKEDGDLPSAAYEPDQSTSRPFGGGWGKPVSTGLNLTQEEAKQRAALQENARKVDQTVFSRRDSRAPNVRSKEPPSNHSGALIRRIVLSSPAPASSREPYSSRQKEPPKYYHNAYERDSQTTDTVRRELEDLRRATVSSSSTERRIEVSDAKTNWTCKCGHVNLPFRENCLQCDSPKDGPTIRSDPNPKLSKELGLGWKHIKTRKNVDAEASSQAVKGSSGDWGGLGAQKPASKDSTVHWTPTLRESATPSEHEKPARPSFRYAFGSTTVHPSEIVSRDVSPADRSARGSGTPMVSSRARRANAEIDADETASFAKKNKKKKRTSRKAFLSDDYNDDEEFFNEDEAPKDQRGPPTPIYLPDFITVGDLARVLRVSPDEFVQEIGHLGFEGASYDHILDAETAGLIATEYNFEPIVVEQPSDLQAREMQEDKSSFPTRPPVVTIMGHVDHGKTTILDWLRKSSVAASEHGGITQHIGAFSVKMPGDKLITFLDTPGHAAFLEMRRRGANVTDIVILVVAADDSVKPQTIEAIKHAQEAKVPMLVAMNKIDKPDANVELVKQDLARNGVNVEDFGGDVQAIPISGKTGQGMGDLEEAMTALSEQLDHRADTGGSAEGWIIEAATTNAGRIATVLVRTGTLKPGDILVAGTTWGRVRTLRNDAGLMIEQAPPGTPVQVDGWREQPSAGDEVLQATDEQQAKDVVEMRLKRAETAKLGTDIGAINVARRAEAERRETEGEETDPWWRRNRENAGWVEDEVTGVKTANFVIKADVSGSVEALVNAVTAIGNNEIHVSVVRSGVGPVSKGDVEHAAVANGHIISFNQPVDGNLRDLAEKTGTSVLDHNIIYKVIDDVKEKLADMLPPIVTQKVHGEAEISKIFDITVKNEKVLIAGCKVTNGVIDRKLKVRVVRGGETIFDGTLSSLKNVKKDVNEIRKGSECGIGFTNWYDFQVGDQIQCYEEKRERRTL